MLSSTAAPFEDFINSYDFDKSDQRRRQERGNELKRRLASGETLSSILGESIRSVTDAVKDFRDAVDEAAEAMAEYGDYLEGQSGIGRLPPKPSRG